MKTSIKYVITDEKIKFSDLEKYLCLVPYERQERIKNFLFDKDKISSLTAGLLIRSESCNFLGIPNGDIQFSFNKYGKPYLSDYPEYYFSVSHSGHITAFACSSSPIGIDAEKVSAYDIGIAENFFAKGEFNYFMESRNKDMAFYDIWTKKEAYAKMLGTGLMIPLESFDVTSGKLNAKFISKCISGYMVNACFGNLNQDIHSLPFQKVDFKELLGIYKSSI